MLAGLEPKPSLYERGQNYIPSIKKIGAATIGTVALFAAEPHILGGAESRQTPSFTGQLDPEEPVIIDSTEQITDKLSTTLSRRARPDCTSLRSRPDYIYMGMACANNGDSYDMVKNGYEDKQQVYAVVRLNQPGKDTFKCGFIRKGVLPAKRTRRRAQTHCINYYPKLVKQRTGFFQDYNCGDKGKDPCVDGTYHSDVTKICPDPVTYSNFDTDSPSPFNVFGTKNGGFYDPIEDNKTTSYRYRVELKIPAFVGGKAVKSIVVRAPEWGFTNTKCVAKGSDRRGGTIDN